MSRSPLLSTLRRHLALALHQRDSGIADPVEAAASLSALRLSRRAALLGIGSAAALAACRLKTGPGDDSGGSDSATDSSVDTAANPLQVAIIGGGIAGLHCAYRLTQAGLAPVVYEASTRTGGRMYTGRDLFLDGQICELGGELIDTDHLTLWALADEFGLQLDDRWAGDDALTETWWIGGVNVPVSTLIAQLLAILPTVNAHIAESQGGAVGFARWNNTSLKDWLTTYVPVASSPELNAALDVAYAGEYGLDTSQQCCMNMLWMLATVNASDTADFQTIGNSDERYHTHLGNDSFPAALAATIAPDQIRVGMTLTYAAANSDGSYTLGFLTADGNSATIACDHVVFALPFTTLRLVDLSGLALSSQKTTIIQTLGYGTNAKVMAGFSRAVWREDHASTGDFSTDLPVQACWDSSIGQTGGSAILTNFLSAAQGVACGDGSAGDWIVGVLPDIEAAWPGTTAAYTGTAVRMHWPTVPTMLGSYSCYLVGQASFLGLEGVREGNVHFCGEHTSPDFQGWMEGAALSGGLVAAEILGDLGVAMTASHARAVGPGMVRRWRKRPV